MERDRMLLRLGVYCGVAARLLKDTGYAERFLSHAEDVTEVDYLEMSAEIKERLLVAGLIAPDEDPYDEVMRK